MIITCRHCRHRYPNGALTHPMCPKCGARTWVFDTAGVDPSFVYAPYFPTPTRIHGPTRVDLVAVVGSAYLGGRYRYQGLYSGEEFLHASLAPALDAYDIVEVALDGILGPSPGFFEEAFGGAVRLYGAEVRHRIQLVAAVNQHLARQITQYMEEAAGALAR